MNFYSILVIFSTILVAIEGKKCCNSECTQVISQARSFREFEPTDADGLSLERDAKIWIFMKEMGLDENGAEMWYGESKGKKGYFPKHLVGEYMVLCRDLVDISYEDTLNQAEEKREKERIERGDGVENVKDGIGNEGGSENQAETPETEENHDSVGEKSSQNRPNTDIPDMVNEWRKQDGEAFTIPPLENIAEFHAPDTEAMQALKYEMDRDFLSRLLEGEGVETVGELDGERLNELMRDSETARILVRAFQEEELESFPRESPEDVEKSDQANPRAISQSDASPDKETPPEDKEIVEEHEISQPNVDETSLHFVVEVVGDNRQSEELPQEDKVDVDSTDNSKSNSDLDEEKLAQGEKVDESTDDPQTNGNSDRENLLEREKLDEGNSETAKDDTDESKRIQEENMNGEVRDDDEQDLDQGENVDSGNPDASESDIDEQNLPLEEKVDDENIDTKTEDIDGQTVDHEISHERDQVNDTPSESTDQIPDHQDTNAPLDLLPSPISHLLRHYIQSHGVASLLLYTLTPVLIAYLYVSRSGARNRVNSHKKESAKHMQVLEQKVVALQKEKKALDQRIAESNKNAVSREELHSSKQELGVARNEIEGNRCYISQLETDNTQRTGELQASQAGLNEKCIHIERLQTLNSSAQEEILALNGKIDGVNNQVTQIETEKLALQVRIDTNIDSYAELKDRLDGVEKSRDQVERDKVKLQQELKEKQVLITANTEQIHTLEGEINVLSKSLLKLQPGSGLSQSDTRTIFDTLTNTAKALSELEEARGVRDRFELENSHFSSENTSLKARCEDLDDNLSCVKSNNILLKKQLGDSETKLQVLNEYFNTKESELHRQLNEVKNSQMLLEGKDQRTHEEIGTVRTEREALKLEISGLKHQHSEREKSLLEQITSLEKRAQENIYNSRRNEQEIRWRDREITELKRKLAESSLPSSQSESYLSPRSTSPSSQLSSNSDTEGGGGKGDKTRESPSLPKFTSGPPTKVEPVMTTAKQTLPPNPYPQAFPPHSFYPPPYPGMMPPYGPPPLLPQGMGPAVFSSPSVPMKRGKLSNVRQSAPDDTFVPKPNYAPEKATAQVENLAPKPYYPPEGYTQPIENLAPKPALYAPSPPTLMDTPNEYTQQTSLFDTLTPPEKEGQQYNGSLLDSQNSTPTQNDSNTFLIDV